MSFIQFEEWWAASGWSPEMRPVAVEAWNAGIDCARQTTTEILDRAAERAATGQWPDLTSIREEEKE
jgi:hypothetical protein